MVEKSIDNFSMARICDSGQCFRMIPVGEDRYIVIAGDRYLEMEQDGTDCRFYCTQEEFDGFWRHYFDLDTDYGAYIDMIDPEDTYLRSAADFGKGIRILNQDLWETIVSFLISQQNNIVRIRRCIKNISERYGRKCVTGDGNVYYAFPGPEDLCDLEEDALMECNLGYRSKYVVRTAKSVVSGETDLAALKSMPYKEAHAALLNLYGVGVKVADCVCLFALHQMDAFPVDTHIRQAMEKHYGSGFPYDKYRGINGLMQQYIFYYELKGAPDK